MESLSKETVADNAARVERVVDAFRELLLATTAKQEVNEQAEDTRRALEVIRAKDNISVPEAAILLSCSDSHLHNLIQKAVDGTAAHPIPFIDLDGVQRFPRVELLEWARTQKKATPGLKDKKGSHLSIASVSRKRGS